MVVSVLEPGTYAIWTTSAVTLFVKVRVARGPTRVPLTALKCILVGSFENEVCIVPPRSRGKRVRMP